jgi:Fe/S biogenesis protein NfuA
MQPETLIVTPFAVEKVKEIARARDRADMAVRVAARIDTPATYKYTLQFVSSDQQEADDTVVDADGVLFFVDAESQPLLRGATLDFVDDLSGSGFKFDNPNQPPLLRDPIAVQVAKLIEERVNPSVAAHGGHVALLDVRDGRVFIRFGGGCQGCGMADVTLKEGIETMIKESVPGVTEVLDTTDHAAGTNPYFAGHPGH